MTNRPAVFFQLHAQRQSFDKERWNIGWRLQIWWWAKNVTYLLIALELNSRCQLYELPSKDDCRGINEMIQTSILITFWTIISVSQETLYSDPLQTLVPNDVPVRLFDHMSPSWRGDRRRRNQCDSLSVHLNVEQWKEINHIPLTKTSTNKSGGET